MNSKLDFEALQANQNLVARNYWKNRLYNFEFNTYFENSDNSLLEEDNQLSHSVTLPISTAAKLVSVARTDKAMHIVLLSALSVLIHKCSSEEDICIFTCIYNKGVILTDDDNMVPVRFTNFVDNNFPKLLSIVKEDLAQDFAYANFPLHRKLQAAAIVPEQISGVILELNSLQTLPKKLPFATSLIFSFTNGQQPSLTISYDKIKFDIELIKQIAHLYCNLLDQLLNNTRTLIRDIAIITPAEQKLIINEFNNTKINFPDDKTLIDFYIASAAKHSDEVAIIFQDSFLTYGVLEARSNQVANFLLKNCHCKGMIVGVLLDRCIDLMPIIFGILKAGCVYLPLSTNYPRERNEYILNDSNASLIFIDSNNSYQFSNVRCVNIQVTKLASDTPCNVAKASDIAYIIYTSGSTGQPKGVMIRHVSLTNRLHWMQRKYKLSATDIILQKTPLVFDVSIWELFWWFMAGAKLVLSPPEAEKDPEQLCRLIEQEKISVLHFVPSMLHIFLSHLKHYSKKNSIKNIRYLFTSGEELKAVDAQEVFKYSNNIKLHNLYGPTEATVDVSYHEVKVETSYRTIPIGKPIDNTTLLIFNKEGQLQPIGIPGELYIGGINVALGYLNKEFLTKEKFIRSPIDKEMILYRTGDLAKWLRNGEIMFLGRMDSQVKIRGNRIELGDVEFAINAHDSVAHSAVLATENGGVLQLAAYIVPSTTYTEEILIQHLTVTLPEYMIPSYFFVVAEIPITTNGKLDRKKLLSIKKITNQTYVAPATNTEVKLLLIWQNVLNTTNIGVNDNFFRIGGDSIFAVKLVGTINNELEQRLAIADLYKTGTVRLLSTYIDESVAIHNEHLYTNAVADLLLFQRAYAKDYAEVSVGTVYPMSRVERHIIQCQQERPEDILFFRQSMQPVNYINFSVNVLQEALDILVEKHEALRTGFNVTHYAHIIYNNVRVSINYQNLTSLSYIEQKETIEKYLQHSRSSPFNSHNFPLWRLTVYKLGESHHELLFEYHGGLLDGWSLSALLAELNEIYLTIKRGQNVRIKPLHTSHRDFILQEMACIQNTQLRYFWKKEMDGFTKLRFNNNEGPRQFSSVRKKSSEQLVAQLIHTAKERETSVKNILFAAYVHTLWALTGQRDIVVGLLSFTRPVQKDGDKMLGCFINPIPVRVQVPVEITWKQWLHLIDLKLNQLKAYEMLPLSDIIDVAGEVVSSTNPLFDTIFNFVHWHLLEAIELDNLYDAGVERLNFDTFSRRDTSFDVNYNMSNQRILNMHEYATPFMDNKTFNNYNALFDKTIEEIISFPDKVTNTILQNFCLPADIE